jgi:hypothetical protein
MIISPIPSAPDAAKFADRFHKDIYSSDQLLRDIRDAIMDTVEKGYYSTWVSIEGFSASAISRSMRELKSLKYRLSKEKFRLYIKWDKGAA